MAKVGEKKKKNRCACARFLFGRGPTALFLSKAQCFLHRGGELTVQRLVGSVGREVQTVETARHEKVQC